jgi:thioredoxin reductase
VSPGIENASQPPTNLSHMDADWECVVVGGGVAGQSAALVLGRARRRTLVLDRGGQSNRPAAHVGGLLGQEGTSPDELYARAREQIALYESVVVQDAEAVDARADGDDFVVVLGTEDEVRTRAIVLATGMDYEVPDVPGFLEHWGGAVFHCPFCHGWEVRDRRLVVYGAGEVAEMQAAMLRGWSSDVTLVDPGEVAALRVEAGTVRALVRHDGSEVACDAVLVHAPLRPRGVLPERLGLALTDGGFVEVDGLAHTSLPGVYAAGDIAVAPQQVAIAMGSGHLAGVVVTRELLLGRPSQR